MAKAKKKEITIEEALVPAEEQPYEVPENWCWTRLENLYEINPKNKADDNSLAAFVPMDKIESGMKSGFTYDVIEWGKIKKGHTQFADGDVAFAKISPCFENRKSMIVNGLINGIGAGTTELIVLRQPAINKEYTFWLVSNEDFINGGCATYSGTVGQQRISMAYVRKYPIPLPPLPEQQRIVERIESLFSKLDEAKEKAQEALDSFAVRKLSILQNAFEGKLTEQWREDNGVTKDNWEKKSLKECGKWHGGGTPKTSVKSYWDKGDIPWITSKDMKDEIIEDSELHITMDGVENSSAVFCEKPSVLFVMRSGILRRVFPICMINRPFTVNQDLKVCVPNGVLQQYLYWYCTGFEKDIRDKCMKSGTTVESIDATKFYEYKICIPTLEEQKEIVSRIEKLIEREQISKEMVEGVIIRIDSLKKSILAKAFRGELGTNDPSEGSAEELLKSILQQS